MARKNNKFADLARTVDAQVGIVEMHVERALNAALDDGLEWMRMVIESSGTGWVGRGPRATPDGRIDYGYMIDSTDRTVVHRDGRTLTGTFGWLEDQEDYFRYQEYGFRHRGGKSVEGMHALAQGVMFARETLEHELRKYK